MSFFMLLALIAIAYFAWRIVDQLPDVVYRLSEIQRDVADLRRLTEQSAGPSGDQGTDTGEGAS